MDRTAAKAAQGSKDHGAVGICRSAGSFARKQEDVAEADVNESLRYGRKQPHRKADGIQKSIWQVAGRGGTVSETVCSGDDKGGQEGVPLFIFPFMFGIYPYTIVSDKQRTAMELAEVDYVYMTIFEITFAEIRKLLNI